jgi:hypothetical protein
MTALEVMPRWRPLLVRGGLPRMRLRYDQKRQKMGVNPIEE